MSGIPEVSFCIPVYNASARIERCLRGVLAQQCQNAEILLVDNASTDDTVAKARAVLEGVPGARIVVNEKNLGRIENWNRCLDLAAGRYIKYALVNDVLMPGSTRLLLRATREAPDVTMVCSNQRNVEGMPEKIAAVPENAPMKVYSAVGALRHLASASNDTGGGGGMLISGGAVREHHLRYRLDIPFWSDFHFAIELAALGSAVYVDAETYLFDKSIKSRFAISGTGANSRSLCFEARACARALARLLPQFGAEPWRGFDFLHAIYIGASWYGEQPVMGWRDTLELFEGAGPYRTDALRYRLERSFPRAAHYTRRALARLGLYRYPWEKQPAAK